MKKLSMVAVLIAGLCFLGWTHQSEDAQQQPVKSPQVTAPAPTPVQNYDLPGDNDLFPASTCFMCSKSSSGACSGADQCSGSRSGCRKKGCKITGTRSCSTAANVKTC